MSGSLLYGFWVSLFGGQLVKLPEFSILGNFTMSISFPNYTSKKREIDLLIMVYPDLDTSAVKMSNFAAVLIIKCALMFAYCN